MPLSMSPSSHEPTPSGAIEADRERQTAEYVRDLLVQLERLARDARLIELAYFLREAQDAARRAKADGVGGST